MPEFMGHSDLAVAYALDILEQDHVDQNIVLDMAGLLLRNDEAEEGKLWIKQLGLRFPRTRLLTEIEAGTSPLLDYP
ncbi:MAG: hypothetical protein ACPGYQ_07045, partial [Candidatus Puniceispirillales bacterium]